MVFFYNLSILLYDLLIKIVALFNLKAKLFSDGRKNWRHLLEQKVDKNARYIWFHCASLGEFEQGRPVIEGVKSNYPGFKILLTFYSPSGYEIRKNYNGADIVCYLPLDTRWNAKSFISITSPEKAYFVKYEFWYNYLNELKKHKIPTYIFSANFRSNQHFFRNFPWSGWFRKMLGKFDHIFVQSRESLELLKSIGFKNVTVAGDTRFDRVAAIAENTKELPVVDKFKGENPLIVAGSTWKPDEELIIRFINKNNGIKYIIAPHEVSEANINRIFQLLKKPAIRFSQITEKNGTNFEVIVVDSIGLLSSLYKYGDLAYIGGGFGVGIHNILEAATFGLPVVFGPNHEKFREARELKSTGGAFCIEGFDNLESAFLTLLNDRNKRLQASETARNYVSQNRGATLLIITKSFKTEV
jgi:3-deoxy-D-manno-octulosonic-acid transferase